eukprot:EG_transcript_31098
MGTSCSSVVPLDPALPAATPVDYGSPAEWADGSDSEPGTPRTLSAAAEWHQQSTWYSSDVSSASESSFHTLNSRGPRPSIVVTASSPGTRARKLLDVPAKHVGPRRRRSTLTYKLRREACYLLAATHPQAEGVRGARRSLPVAPQADAKNKAPALPGLNLSLLSP